MLFCAKTSSFCNKYGRHFIMIQNIKTTIWENPRPFKNRIMVRVCVRSNTRSTMAKKLHFVSRKIGSVACGISSIKIDYSDYMKRLISRINEVYVFQT